MASVPQAQSTANTTTPLPTTIITFPNNITVRPYHPSDAASISLNANNPAIKNNLRNRFPYPYLESHALDWITHSLDPSTFVASGPWDATTQSPTGPSLPTQYAITLSSPNTGNTAIGSIGLDFGTADEVYCRTAEIGYWLGEAYWGQGIMGAVAKAFVEWTWRTFGVLGRLNAEVEEGNVGSRRVLERAGLKVEGRREKAIWKGGEFRGLVLMGMVRPDRVVEVEEGEGR